MSDRFVHVSEVRTFKPLANHAQGFEALSVAKLSAKTVRDDANVTPVETLARLWNHVAILDGTQALMAALYVAYFEGRRREVYGSWGELMGLAPSVWQRLEVGRRTLATHTNAPDWALSWLPRPKPHWRFARRWRYALTTRRAELLAAVCELAEWVIVLREGVQLPQFIVELPAWFEQEFGTSGRSVVTAGFRALACGASPCQICGRVFSQNQPPSLGPQVRVVGGAHPALLLDSELVARSPASADPERFSAWQCEMCDIDICSPVAKLAQLVAQHPDDSLQAHANRMGVDYRKVSALAQQLGGLRWVRERSQVILAVELHRSGWSRARIASHFGVSARALSRQVLTWSGAHLEDFDKGESWSPPPAGRKPGYAAHPPHR